MSWKDLESELAHWHGAGLAPDLWWRDDDAGRSSPELLRLLGLARVSGVPLALAVVPAHAEPGLLAALAEGVTVIQHGSDHVNRAAAGEKKTEFSVAEAAPAALARLDAAKKQLQELSGTRFCPVLAPPWNRLPEPLVPLLKPVYAGLSRYGARKASGSPRQINTHVDIIDWRGGRGFVGDDAALQMAVRHLTARRRGEVDREEPTGLLTHHALHDEAAGRFLERLFEFTRARGARWRGAGELFG